VSRGNIHGGEVSAPAAKGKLGCSNPFKIDRSTPQS
jgi:hypothetical protein